MMDLLVDLVKLLMMIFIPIGLYYLLLLHIWPDRERN